MEPGAPWLTLYGMGTRMRFYENAKPKTPRALVGYDFDTSWTLSVPGDWNWQRAELFCHDHQQGQTPMTGVLSVNSSGQPPSFSHLFRTRCRCRIVETTLPRGRYAANTLRAAWVPVAGNAGLQTSGSLRLDHWFVLRRPAVLAKSAISFARQRRFTASRDTGRPRCRRSG